MGSGVEPGQDTPLTTGSNGFRFDDRRGAPAGRADATDVNGLAIRILEQEPIFGFRGLCYGAKIMACRPKHLIELVAENGRSPRGAQKRRDCNRSHTMDLHGHGTRQWNRGVGMLRNYSDEDKVWSESSSKHPSIL